jgi:hypothetical protein
VGEDTRKSLEALDRHLTALADDLLASDQVNQAAVAYMLAGDVREIVRREFPAPAG